jgi:hypothetical protein
MYMRENITRFNQRLHRWEHSFVLSTEKLVHKREFWVIVITALIFGLILAFIFAQTPLTGELKPVPFYPYAQ